MPSAVRLQIYDVGTSAVVHGINRLLKPLGTGAFHTGVEVFGQEVAFGNLEQTRCGIYFCRPRKCPGHLHIEQVLMGQTELSRKEFHRLVQELCSDWLSDGYDLLSRNCCHFADTLCRRLGVEALPARVLNLAGAGAGVLSVVGPAQPAASSAADSGVLDCATDPFALSGVAPINFNTQVLRNQLESAHSLKFEELDADLGAICQGEARMLERPRVSEGCRKEVTIDTDGKSTFARSSVDAARSHDEYKACINKGALFGVNSTEAENVPLLCGVEC